MNKKLICHIDCTQEISEGEKYFEIGKTFVKETEAGRYRESANTKHSRFGYRVKLNDTSKPHLLVVMYPDDRRSFMCINVGTSEGAKEHGVWMRRIADFMKFSGQNRLIYPINWYHGPIVPVKSQPYSRFNTLSMGDRKEYFVQRLRRPTGSNRCSENLTAMDLNSPVP